MTRPEILVMGPYPQWDMESVRDNLGAHFAGLPLLTPVVQD